MSAPRERRQFSRWARLPHLYVLVEIAVVAAAIVLFLLLGRLYGSDPVAAADFAAQRLAHALRSPAMDVFMTVASRFGAEWLWVAWLPVTIILLATHRWHSALALVIVVIATHPFNDTLKDLYQRARPSVLEGAGGSQAFSFPSGHAMAAGAVYGMLLLLAWRELRGVARWVAMLLCVAIALLVAATRVYLNVHYLSDVVAGLVVGTLLADAVLIAWRMLAYVTATRALLGTGQQAPNAPPSTAPNVLDSGVSPKGPLSGLPS